METDTKLNKIEKDIMELKMDLITINNKLDTLLFKIDSDVSTECKKMGEHIDFVENVYSSVRRPLGFICNRVNNLILGYRHVPTLEAEGTDAFEEEI